MQEEITRLVQGLDDSALRFIEACVRHERETRNAPPGSRPPSTPHPRAANFTVPENVRPPDLGTARRRLQGVS